MTDPIPPLHIRIPMEVFRRNESLKNACDEAASELYDERYATRNPDRPPPSRRVKILMTVFRYIKPVQYACADASRELYHEYLDSRPPRPARETRSEDHVIHDDGPEPEDADT